MEVNDVLNLLGQKNFLHSAISLDWLSAYIQDHRAEALALASRLNMADISAAGLKDLIQISESEDALNVMPLSWGLSLKEPQISKALAVFLNHRDEAIKRMRVQQFLSAFDILLPPDAFHISIENEQMFPAMNDFNGGQIDLCISWYSPDETYCAAIIEIKLGSALGDEQLRKYENYANGTYQKVSYIFLIESLKNKDMVEIESADKHWPIYYWWAFLRNWESQIQVSENSGDDLKFQQFRSTLWNQLT